MTARARASRLQTARRVWGDARHRQLGRRLVVLAWALVTIIYHHERRQQRQWPSYGWPQPAGRPAASGWPGAGTYGGRRSHLCGHRARAASWNSPGDVDAEHEQAIQRDRPWAAFVGRLWARHAVGSIDHLFMSWGGARPPNTNCNALGRHLSIVPPLSVPPALYFLVALCG